METQLENGRVSEPGNSAPSGDETPTAATDGPVLELRQVSKRFGAKQAVYPLSLELYAGEVFAILGPNGAGKTTTLKMTTGLLRSDTGSVSVCGHDMTRDGRQAKQALAYVPDQPFLYDKLTGREFIRFAAEIYGVPGRQIQMRLAILSERLDMEPFLDQLTEAYSHGMKQKVALAAAMIHEPQVLVVDEPIVGLDPRTIRVIKDMFREIALRGGTVFMSTHTLDIVESIADRIAIIHCGQLVALGSFAELRQHEPGGAGGGRLEDIFLRLTGVTRNGDAAATGLEGVA